MSDDQDQPRRGGDAGTERALDELRVALEQLASRMGAGFREELAQIQAIAASLAARDVTGDIEALRVDVASLVGRDGASDLRGEIAAVRTELHAVRGQLGDGHGSLLEDLQDNLADVASGEVVGALWDEVRRLRADLPDLVAQPEPSAAAPAEPDPQLGQLTDELAVLRNELAEGLVVEPSDALSSSLDALKDEIDGLRSAIGELRTAPAPVADVPADDGRDQELLGQLAAVRTGIDEVRTRLDEGLVLAEEPDALAGGRDDQVLEQLGAIRAGLDEVRSRLDEVPVPAPAAALDEADLRAGPDEADLEAVADQVASLRDFVSSELDTLRQTISARLDAAADATAATVAEVAARPAAERIAPVAAQAGIDADSVEALRAEIRAAGAIGDQVVDALREELKALRRRIAVKASERVLDDQQLAQIADAVANRLAQGGADG